MSTPEERLKKAAEEMEAQRQEAERLWQEEEARRKASLRERAQRASNMGSKYLRRAQELSDATRKRIYLHLDYEAREGEDPGFDLRVGHRYGLRALLSENGWRVLVRGGRESYQTTHETDEQFERTRDAILESLMVDALEALMRGEDEPAPDEYR